MIASLAMYQRPELLDAHNELWSLIRANLLAQGMVNIAPSLSSHHDEFYIWKHPQLLLSQTCGMPYRCFLHDHVTLVGTPDYALDDCPPGYYRSAIVVRADDSRSTLDQFRLARFAFNQSHSQSGLAAAYAHLQTQGFWFSHRRITGSHRNSVHSVARGQADIASIDALSWRLLNRYDPVATELRVLEWTAASPGLPYIAAAGVDAELRFSAVSQAIADLSESAREKLGIKTLIKIDKASYLAVDNPPACAGEPSGS